MSILSSAFAPYTRFAVQWGRKEHPAVHRGILHERDVSPSLEWPVYFRAEWNNQLSRIMQSNSGAIAAGARR